MSLTDLQLASVKADILANPALNAHPNVPDGNLEIKKHYEQNSAKYVFKTSLPAYSQSGIEDSPSVITSLDWTEFFDDQKTIAAHRDALKIIMMGGSIHPSNVSTRTSLQGAFANHPNSLTAILTNSIRLATNLEELFVIDDEGPGGGDGTTPSGAAKLKYEGTITIEEIQKARNLP